MASTTAAIRAPSKRVRVQQLWLSIHRWIGLVLVLVFAAFAITGSLLVWPDHFDRIVNSDRYPADASVTPAPPSVFLAAAQTALPPGDAVSALRYPEGIAGVRVAGQVNGPAPLGVGPASRTMVWLDPADGAVLSSVGQGGGFLWSLRAFHGHMLLATGGREVVAIIGLVLLVSAGSGLWLWWPGLRNIARALKWRRQASVSMNLHRHGGAIIVVILLIEAFTGTYVAVPALFASVIEPSSGAGGHEEGPPVTRTMTNPRQNIDQVLSSALALVPGGKPLTLFLPTEISGRWIVNLTTSDGERTVTVADASGETRVAPVHEPGPAERVEHVMQDLHFGNYGPVWQIVVFLSGILLAMLAITGPLLWLQGRARRVKRPQPA